MLAHKQTGQRQGDNPKDLPGDRPEPVEDGTAEELDVTDRCSWDGTSSGPFAYTPRRQLKVV
jgi:hypothetical protein